MADELLWAILRRDPPLQELLRRDDLPARDRRCAELRVHLNSGDWRRDSLDATRRMLNDVMHEPPEDTGLYQTTLCSAAMVAMQRGHYEEARQVLGLAEDLARAEDPAELTAYRLAEQARLADLLGEGPRGLELLNRALSLDLPRGLPVWLFVKTCRAVQAAALGQLDLARADLADLSPWGQTPAARWFPVEYTEALVALAEGRCPAALQRIESIIDRPGGVDPKRLTFLRVELLIRLGRLTRAERVLAGQAGRQLAPPVRAVLRALAAMRQRRLDEARQCLRRALQNETEVQTTTYEREAGRKLQAELELAEGNARAARRVLDSEPLSSGAAQLGLRIRLARLEGDSGRAHALLAEMVDKWGLGRLAEEMRLAHEMSAADLADLIARFHAGSCERRTMQADRSSQPDIPPPTWQPVRGGESADPAGSPTPAVPPGQGPSPTPAETPRPDTAPSSTEARRHRTAPGANPTPARTPAGTPGASPTRPPGPAAATPPAGPTLVGAGRAMQLVRRQIARCAGSDATVLILGETGTGKELAGRLIHAWSGRATKPFVPINCGALSETLFESELFGHRRGAFTGASSERRGLLEHADGGVVLLDEIQSLPARLQAALLRVLEDGWVRRVGDDRPRRVDVRILAAGNEPLDCAVRDGKFRPDLYYRLKQLTVSLPPLRHRPEDLRCLVEHFLQPLFDRYEVVVDDSLIEALSQHDWPGNVRELKHAVERIALLAGDHRVLTAELLHDESAGADADVLGRPRPDADPARGHGPKAPGEQAAAMNGVMPPPRPGDTRARRAYIRSLFATRGQLSRAEIIRAVGCAPKTATRDLKHLQAEGLIRRVETSGHLRTSYFVWQGE